MTKKDRIAIVISVLAIFLAIIAVVTEGAHVFVLVVLFLIIYWGYRFIKNDISFLQVKNK